MLIKYQFINLLLNNSIIFIIFEFNKLDKLELQ